tara:strand:+ start:168 stop:878 length:711 start_codon:yes stop_codon:yes gene_type:complete
LPNYIPLSIVRHRAVIVLLAANFAHRRVALHAAIPRQQLRSKLQRRLLHLQWSVPKPQRLRLLQQQSGRRFHVQWTTCSSSLTSSTVADQSEVRLPYGLVHPSAAAVALLAAKLRVTVAVVDLHRVALRLVALRRVAPHEPNPGHYARKQRVPHQPRPSKPQLLLLLLLLLHLHLRKTIGFCVQSKSCWSEVAPSTRRRVRKRGGATLGGGLTVPHRRQYTWKQEREHGWRSTRGA